MPRRGLRERPSTEAFAAPTAEMTKDANTECMEPVKADRLWLRSSPMRTSSASSVEPPEPNAALGAAELPVLAAAKTAPAGAGA